MHKKRLRKKLGNRCKKKVMMQSRMFAFAQSAMIAASGCARMGLIRASIFTGQPASKPFALAQTCIDTASGMAESFEPFYVARDLSVEDHYRKHFNYPVVINA